MATAEGKVFKRTSDSRWVAQIELGYGPDGKRRRTSVTDKSKNEAIRKRAARMQQIAKGEWTPGTKPTLEAWLDTWLTTVAIESVRPRTYSNYLTYARRHIIPVIGGRKLDKLTPTDIRHLHKTMTDNGTGDRVIQATHNTLSSALKTAVREGIIPTNPCDRMDKPRALSKEREALSLAEVQALLTVVAGERDGGARWMMALMLGERQAEVLGMEWDRIDLDRGTVDVSWQLQQLPWSHGQDCGCREGKRAASCPDRLVLAPKDMELRQCYLGWWWTRPKTSASVRIVPMPAPLMNALHGWREAAPANSHNLVWANDKGHPVTGKDDRAAWKEVCRRAGVREVDLHSARHTMVSLLLAGGVSPEVIRQIAGHSSVLSTRNYMHVSTEDARAALSMFDS